MLFRRELKQTEADEKMKDRLAEVERSLRLIQLEWADTLDRLKTMMFRAIKERQRAEEAKGENPVDTPPPQASRLDPVSERILARRSRIAGGTQ